MKKTYELSKGWSDWVKLGAAILVAVSHYSTVICINLHWSNSSFLRLWCQGAYIGVALFFFFSGYGLMESEKKRHLGLKEFFTKRFLKVYLPALLVSVCWIPLYYGIVDTDHSALTLWGVLYDIVWGFQDPVLWFIKILFILYGLFYGFCWLRSIGNNLLAHVLMIGGTALTIWCAIEFSFPFIAIPLFTIGLYSSLLKEKTPLRIPSSIWMLGAMGVICTGLFALTKMNIIAHGILNSIVTAAVLAVVYALNRATPIRLPKACISGNYMIYLIHMKVLTFMVAEWGHISFGSWALTSIVVTVIFTYIKGILKI